MNTYLPIIVYGKEVLMCPVCRICLFKQERVDHALWWMQAGNEDM